MKSQHIIRFGAYNNALFKKRISLCLNMNCLQHNNRRWMQTTTSTADKRDEKENPKRRLDVAIVGPPNAGEKVSVPLFDTAINFHLYY